MRWSCVTSDVITTRGRRGCGGVNRLHGFRNVTLCVNEGVALLSEGVNKSDVSGRLMRSRAVSPGLGSIGGSCGTEGETSLLCRNKLIHAHLRASTLSHFNSTYCQTGDGLSLQQDVLVKFTYEILDYFVSSLILGVIPGGDICCWRSPAYTTTVFILNTVVVFRIKKRNKSKIELKLVRITFIYYMCFVAVFILYTC